jgi:hypothetical protein
MFRVLATLAFDVLLTGGRYIAAADQLVLTVAQHF